MMYIFSERGDQELCKTVSIMFIRHFWTILQYPEVFRVFSGIEYGAEVIMTWAESSGLKCFYELTNILKITFLMKMMILCRPPDAPDLPSAILENTVAIKSQTFE